MRRFAYIGGSVLNKRSFNNKGVKYAQYNSLTLIIANGKTKINR